MVTTIPIVINDLLPIVINRLLLLLCLLLLLLLYTIIIYGYYYAYLPSIAISDVHAHGLLLGHLGFDEFRLAPGTPQRRIHRYGQDD